MEDCAYAGVKGARPKMQAVREARVSESRARVMHILPHVAAGGATLAAMELARSLDPDHWDV
ncbi:MAG: hypothetical protein GF393_04700, partial [Armatimonadia bacterium]|nr:hypothetical protein [Armatimonadia bacterium]